MYLELTENEHETVAAVSIEDRMILNDSTVEESRDDEFHFQTRSSKESIKSIELPGYCLITTPTRIRQGTIYADPHMVSSVPLSLQALAVRNELELEAISPLLGLSL